MAKAQIPFSPPDINDDDINAVVETLKSGWITTGPRTKRFEKELAEFTEAERVVALSSGSAALETALRALDVGAHDEVITSAYTYTATCSSIIHVNAKPVLCDTAPDSYEMDYSALSNLITKNTRVVMPVDLAGRMVDYDRLFEAIEKGVLKSGWQPHSLIEETLGRPVVLADGAHALGATYHGRSAGSVADFTAFSFHAVKNLTTSEGGALAWRRGLGIDDEALYHTCMLLSLHGQDRDALAKTKPGSWEYDIIFPGYKCNMTDIQAALGSSQLKRYPELLTRRHEIAAMYELGLADLPIEVLSHYGSKHDAHGEFVSSAHLMLCRLTGKDEIFRNTFITEMGKRGVATNVHYKPLPLLTAYRSRGFDIADYPNAYAQYENEVTLPLHTKLSDEDVAYICAMVHDSYEAAERLEKLIAKDEQQR
ncbi:MAG: DegT/DnrJ/EryC1/StrS family aminotransferase [Eggerthellaceae bacterium]|nr:DegT/DnrJ/EryC1/StrS family aminotransferase [Eggerthellaceae bacterium]